jgi:2-hydroxy-6-oxonona-2,4-dienedioate hydrolase
MAAGCTGYATSRPSRSGTVWVPDLPGFGDSDELGGEPHGGGRMQHLVDALIGSLDTLVGRQAAIDVAGFSFGGLVAAYLAAQRPNVRALALLGPGGHGAPRRERAPMVDWRLPDPATRIAALRHNLHAQMLHEPREDALALAVHQLACEKTRFRSKALSRSPVLQQVLEGYGGPVLFIWGEHDVTADPVAVAPRLAQHHPEREWVLVPGAGHWVQYERCREVDRLLLRWFQAGAQAFALQPVEPAVPDQG